jgi:hypothetical protein
MAAYLVCTSGNDAEEVRTQPGESTVANPAANAALSALKQVSATHLEQGERTHGQAEAEK